MVVSAASSMWITVLLWMVAVTVDGTVIVPRLNKIVSGMFELWFKETNKSHQNGHLPTIDRITTHEIN